MKKSKNQGKAKRRWGRRLLTIGAVLFALYLIAGFLLLPLGVKFLAPGIAAKHLKGKVDPGWVWLNPLTFQLSAKELSWEYPEGEEIFGLGLLRVNANPVGSLFKGDWRIEQILVDGMRTDLRIDENGSLNIVEALLPRVPAEVEKELEESDAEFQLPAAWLGALEVSDAFFSLTDLSGQHPFSKVVSPINFRMTDIRTGPEEQNDYQFSAVTRDNEQIELSGSFYFDPLSLHGTLSGKELRLSDYTLLVTPTEDLRVLSGLLDFSFDFEARVLEQPLTAALRNAQLRLREMDMRLEADQGASLRLEDMVMQNVAASVTIDGENGFRAEAGARLEMNGFRAVLDDEEQPVMAFKQFRIENARVSALPLSIQTGDIVLSALDLSIERTPTGELAVMGLFPKNETGGKSPPADVAPVEAESDGPLPELEIARFILEQGSLRFQDASVSPAADVSITPIDFSVEPVTLSAEKRTKAAFAATVMELGRIQLDSELLARDPLRAAQATLTVRDLPLVAATPYTTAFIGRPVEEGSFSGDFDIGLNQKQLEAKNALRVQSIRLGETVSGYSGKTYPVGTAIALMENNEGLIEINVPVSGSLDDPTFHPFQVFTKVLQNLVLKAATAPFNIAASMTGGVISGLTSAAGLQGEPAADYSRVTFAAGSAQLDDQAGKVLEVIADMLDSRPNIRLRIQGSVEPTGDLQALQEARFRNRLESVPGTSRTERIRNAYKQEILGQASFENQPATETTSAPDPEQTPAEDPAAERMESGEFLSEEPVEKSDRPTFYLSKGNSSSTAEAKGFYLQGGTRKPPAMRPVVRAPDPVAQASSPPVESAKTSEAPPSTGDEPATDESGSVTELPAVNEMERLLSELWFDSPPDFRELATDRAQAVRQALVNQFGIAQARLMVEESTAREGSFAIFHIETQFNNTNEE